MNPPVFPHLERCSLRDHSRRFAALRCPAPGGNRRRGLRAANARRNPLPQRGVLDLITPEQTARFWSSQLRVADCVLWTGPKNEGGYGLLTAGRGQSSHRMLAHRVAWALANGREVPAGMVVMHSCDRRLCVNPDHLDVGTQQDNVDQAVARRRHAHGDRHPRAVLTADQVMAIRAESAILGSRVRALATRWAVSPETIRAVIGGNRWGHLPLVPRPTSGSRPPTVGPAPFPGSSWVRTETADVFVEEGHAADGVVVRLVAVAARDQGVRSWTVFALATRDGRVPPGVAGVLGCRQVPRSEVFPALDAMRAEADGWGLAAVLYSAERG